MRKKILANRFILLIKASTFTIASLVPKLFLNKTEISIVKWRKDSRSVYELMKLSTIDIRYVASKRFYTAIKVGSELNRKSLLDFTSSRNLSAKSESSKLQITPCWVTHNHLALEQEQTTASVPLKWFLMNFISLVAVKRPERKLILWQFSKAF